MIPRCRTPRPPLADASAIYLSSLSRLFSMISSQWSLQIEQPAARLVGERSSYGTAHCSTDHRRFEEGTPTQTAFAAAGSATARRTGSGCRRRLQPRPHQSANLIPTHRSSGSDNGPPDRFLDSPAPWLPGSSPGAAGPETAPTPSPCRSASSRLRILRGEWPM
jgi:hypothetical protein